MTWDNRYRPLREGETITAGDECLTDGHLGWQPATHDIGGKAPDPAYTAHRMYRRLRTSGRLDVLRRARPLWPLRAQANLADRLSLRTTRTELGLQ